MSIDDIIEDLKRIDARIDCAREKSQDITKPKEDCFLSDQRFYAGIAVGLFVSVVVFIVLIGTMLGEVAQ